MLCRTCFFLVMMVTKMMIMMMMTARTYLPVHLIAENLKIKYKKVSYSVSVDFRWVMSGNSRYC